jgi:hypothetical protein
MSFDLTLSSFQSRILALALAAIPLMAVLLLATGLAMAWSGHHARVAALTAQRDAYRRSLSQEPALDASLRQLDAEKRASGYFFGGADNGAATARIRSRLSDIIGRDGATVARDDVELVAAGEDSPIQLRASVSFTGDIKSLTRVLYDLRREKPLLFVTQLVVHSQAGSASWTAPNKLQVDLVAVNYLDAP